MTDANGPNTTESRCQELRAEITRLTRELDEIIDTAQMCGNDLSDLRLHTNEAIAANRADIADAERRGVARGMIETLGEVRNMLWRICEGGMSFLDGYQQLIGWADAKYEKEKANE